MTLKQSKKSAAARAAKYIMSGMTVGLGTGTTVEYLLEEIARRIKEDKLRIVCVPTSVATEQKAKKLGIPLTGLKKPIMSMCIDGADEVDKKFNLIKGGGGALTREKIVASAAADFTVIVDESKVVNKIGEFPLPVEVIPFAQAYVANELKEIGGEPLFREKFKTDNGNIILDVTDLSFSNPLELETELNNIPGIVDNGVFAIRTPNRVLIGKGKEVNILASD